MIFNCPGSQRFKKPIPESIRCPFCKNALEIWTDEFEVVCARCGKKVSRDNSQSCISWCALAKECVGKEIYREHEKNRSHIKKKGVRT